MASVIMPKSQGNTGKTTRSNSKDKIFSDYNTNGCKHSGDHIVDGKIIKHACSFCFQEVGRFCSHRVQEWLRRKAGDKDIPKTGQN